MAEEWRRVVGYEDFYIVSSLGRIRRIDNSFDGTNQDKFKDRKHSVNNRNGYVQVSLCKNNNPKTKKVHRIVASAFIPNPNNKREVNHIDGNKLNNVAENLEWVTPSENQLHSYHVLGTKPPRAALGKFGKDSVSSKRCVQLNTDGTVVREWDCLSDVERGLGISTCGVSACCNGNQKTHKGFIWKFIK